MSNRRNVGNRMASKKPQQQQQQQQNRANKSRQVRITVNNNDQSGSGTKAFRLRNNHRNNYNNNNNESPRIIVSGIPATVDREDLMHFIKTKAYKPNIVFTNNEFRNGKLYLSLEKSDDIGSLVSLTGCRYGGVQISIDREYVQPLRSQPNKTHKEKILHERLVQSTHVKLFEDFIATRYSNNPQQEFLDLSFIYDPEKPNMLDLNSEKILKILYKIIKDKCPKANTISLANNSITTLMGFRSMIKFSLDNIINFNFSNNKISDLTELDFLSDLSLRELLFVGNPITFIPTYRMEVARRFPDLVLLDSVKIGPQDFPPSQIPPLRGNFSDSPDRQQFAWRFLEKYLSTFDKNRSEIVHAYNSESKFSMTFTSDRSNTRGSTKTYLRSSRNLKKQMPVEKKSQLLFTGATDINSFFKLFPTTSHYVQQTCIDTFLAPGSSVLFVIIHGHYLETIFNTKRSFDRIFSLVPASQESAKFGWEASILNEQLHVRPYTRFPRLESAPQVPSADTASQETLITQFSSATNLKPEFAKECLINNGWDSARAMEMFNSLKASSNIPQNYYM